MMEWITVHVLEKYNFWIAMFIIIIGLTATLVKENLLKKLIGLSIFQTAFFLWVVSLGDVGRKYCLLGLKNANSTHFMGKGQAQKGYIYANPLPSCTHADRDRGEAPASNCSRPCHCDQDIPKVPGP